MLRTLAWAFESEARHLAPLPLERKRSLPFLLINDRLLCPWGPKAEPDTEDWRRLEAAREAIANLAGHFMTPVWVCADGRLQAFDASTEWLSHYRRDHAEIRLTAIPNVSTGVEPGQKSTLA
jgi:hypothetical protein